MSMIGKSLAHYEVTAEIGKGGMGEVYKAKDQKLGRDVAIKVLPEEFAKDADRVARFQREAKLLASLNHPNIAAIHGLEEADGTHFLVLELVEGQTLAERVKVGPINVEEALKLGLQIAEALEAAHEKGVIHRDLKPANIKVTPDGKVKVLDFGLAKAFAGQQDQVNLSNSPTLSDMATQQGLILGTAAYMSPEQARGKPVDKRTDVWAFGCVLYEMLTGKAAFQGEDVTEILAAVMKSSVNMDLLPANIHFRVREVITRCLQKEQKKRYPEISQAHYEIEQVLADPGGVFLQPSAITKSRKKLRVGLPWVAAIAILGIIIAGAAVWYLKPSEPRQVTRLFHELPKDQQFGNLTERAFAVSPDGRQFVYSTTEGLYLRAMDELDAKIIPGTGGNPQKPFFSPDGKWVGYVAGNQLKKIAISGGAPSVITEAATIGYIDWQTDDTIVFSHPGMGIMRISANGGNPEAIVKENELIISPQILPDGKSVLYTSLSLASTNIYSICVQSLESGERKELFPGSTARYLPTGHIVYAVHNDLFAIRFDPDKLEVIGGPVSVVEGIFTGAAPQYAVSNSGTLIYMPRKSADAGASARNLVWVDRNGKEEPIAVPPDLYSNPRISPDGKQVALTVGNIADADIWIWDLVRKTLSPLTRDPSPDAVPLWTADGKRIAFMSLSGGSGKIYLKLATGTGKVEPLGSDYGGAPLPLPSSWSGDGKELVFMGLNFVGATPCDIGAVEMEGERKFRPLLKEKYFETEPKISPNGQWMAYTSDESGKYEIYVRPFPDVDSGGKWTVSTGGGTSPLWAPSGRELFYRNGDEVMAVSVKTETTFSPETPKTLFRGTYVSLSSGIANLPFNSWDISQDGKRFLMLKPGASTGEAPVAAGPRRINVVLNWFEELKQNVPTD